MMSPLMYVIKSANNDLVGVQVKFEDGAYIISDFNGSRVIRTVNPNRAAVAVGFRLVEHGRLQSWPETIAQGSKILTWHWLLAERLADFFEPELLEA